MPKQDRSDPGRTAQSVNEIIGELLALPPDPHNARDRRLRAMLQALRDQAVVDLPEALEAGHRPSQAVTGRRPTP